MRLFVPTSLTPDWTRRAAAAINFLLRPETMNFKPSAQPSSPEEGCTYYDSTTKKIRTWNGTAWFDLF